MAKQTGQSEKCTAPGGGGNRLGTQESEDELAAGQVCVLTQKECTACSWGSQRAFQQPDVSPSGMSGPLNAKFDP